MVIVSWLGEPISVSEAGGAVPITKVSSGGADYIGFTRGGETIHWSIGPMVKTANVAELFRDAPKGEDDEDKFTPPETGISLAMTVNAAKPSGTVAFTGARVLTMTGEGAGAIDNATVVVTGDITQIDLPSKTLSGLKHVLKVKAAESPQFLQIAANFLTFSAIGISSMIDSKPFLMKVPSSALTIMIFPSFAAFSEKETTYNLNFKFTSLKNWPSSTPMTSNYL